jgi:hypothetical protein
MIERAEVIKRGKEIITKLSPSEFKVLNGSFKGLKYPHIDFIGRASLPTRIIGSYEMQLHPLIEKIISTAYSDVIDVGSAEGYYAVGLAMRMPQSTIHCFDIDEFSLNYCKEMAQYNNLHNLTYNNWCSPETLINFLFQGRGLIFCDCEGYELELFTQEVIGKLTNIDVLIELHDVFNPIISAEILSRFQDTHHFEIINNLNINFSQLIGLDNLSDEEKTFATYEHRGGLCKDLFMEWAFFTPRNKL